MISTALWHQITNDSTVQTYLSTRIYPERLPAGIALPAGTIHRLGTIRVDEFFGSANCKAARFNVKLIAESHIELLNATNAVIDAIDSASGTIAGVDVDHFEITGEHDAPWIAGENEQQRRYVRIIDIIGWYR